MKELNPWRCLVLLDHFPRLAVHWSMESGKVSRFGCIFAMCTVCSINLKIVKYCPISWTPMTPWMSWAHLFACRPFFVCDDALGCMHRALGRSRYVDPSVLPEACR
jgi:hypothetical protein